MSPAPPPSVTLAPGRLRRWLLLALATLGLVACTPTDRVELDLSLSVPVEEAVPAEAVVEVTWLGEERAVVLVPADTGSAGGATRLVGSLEGPPLRLLPLRLRVRPIAGAPLQTWHDTLLPVPLGRSSLHLAVLPGGEGAIPVSRAGTVAADRTAEVRQTGARAAWFVGVLVAVLALVRRTGPTPGRQPPTRWPWWADALVWGLLALALTWPAVLAGPERLVGRYFDLLGTSWIIDAAPRLLPGLSDPLTAWPEGADYRSMDSWTLLLLALPGQLLDPARLHGLLQVLGLAASGWAATAAARGLGARGPAALLGGAGFVLGGLSANVLLEGHVYHLLDPWLPLLLWAWCRAAGPQGTARDGLLAGLFFALCLLTTGYLAMAAGVIVGVIGLHGLRQRRAAFLPPAAAALAVALPVVVGVAWSLSSGGEARVNWLPEVVQGSVDLTRLLGATAQTDRLSHGMATNPPATVLALAALAPVVLRRQAGWRVLVLTGLVALLLSLGPAWKASPWETVVPSPLAFLWSLPGGALLRFPARLSWVWMLVLGILAARVATRLRPGRWGGLLLLAMLVVDVVWVTGLPRRQGSIAAGAPSAYDLPGDGDSGAVLDLLPESVSTTGQEDTWLSAQACLHQLRHGRPVAEDCVTVPVRGNPRFRHGAEVLTDLLAGDPAGAQATLAGYGYEAVAWQPDLFAPPHRSRVAATLAYLDPAPVVSRDGGAHLQRFAVPGDDAGLPTRPDAPALWDATTPERAPSSLEVLLRSPPGFKAPQALRVAVEDATGRAQSVALSAEDRGARPGEALALWRATLADPGPGPLAVRLVELRGGEETPVWSGRIAPTTQAERLDLRLSRGDFRRLHGEIGALVAPSHPRDPRARPGLVALAGWATWLLLAVTGTRSLRRRRKP